MKIGTSKHSTIALAAALALFCTPVFCRAGEYEKLAAELVNTVKTQGLSRLVIEEFAAQGLAAAGTARTAQQQLSGALFELRTAGVMDAAVIEKLKERGRRWAQVRVEGAVYRTGSGLSLVVKLTNIRSGLRMATMQVDLPEGAHSPAAGDFRDAPGDPGATGCARALERLKAAGRAAVDLSARHWAIRARAPGFSYSALDSAPGSEIRDYATMQKFYTLFNAYYEQDGPVTLTNEERTRLKELAQKETRVRGECPAAN